MSSYMDAYQQSLNQSRSQINQQLQQALGQIAQQQQAANQAVGTLPGQFSDVYGKSQNALNQYSNQLDAAQKASGIGSFAPESSYMAPVQQAMSGSLDFLKSEVPMMQLGVNQGYAGLMNQARGTAATLGSQLDTEQRNYLSSLAQEQMKQQAANNSAAMQNAWQAEQNRLSREANLQDIQAQQQGAPDPYAQADIKSAGQSSGIPQATLAKMFSDPNYAGAKSFLATHNNAQGYAMMANTLAPRYGVSVDQMMKLLQGQTGNTGAYGTGIVTPPSSQYKRFQSARATLR